MKIRTAIRKTCTAIKMLAIGSVFLVVAGGIVWQGGRNFQVAMEDEESLQVQVKLAKNRVAYNAAEKKRSCFPYMTSAETHKCTKRRMDAPSYTHGTFDIVDGRR